MKKAHIVCLLLAAATAQAQRSAGGLTKAAGDAMAAREKAANKEQFQPLLKSNRHPFRKAVGQFWDLRPFTESARTNIPPNIKTNWFVLRAKVIQVLPDGLLLMSQPSAGSEIVFLKNHPDQDKKVDDDWIADLVIRDGIYRYTSVQGAVKSVRCFDYGIPFNPWAKTNTPSK